MIAILYRWKLKPGRAEDFAAAWHEVTVYFREHYDSLGSRLHRGADGNHYAYAQWRRIEDREAAFADESVSDSVARMRDAIDVALVPVVLEIVDDQIVSIDAE